MQTTSVQASKGVSCDRSFSVLLPLISVCVFFCLSGAVAQEDFLISDPLEGRQLFETKGCQQCHAIRGHGGSVAMDLGWHEYYGSIFALAADLWNHSPIMTEVMEELSLERPVFAEDEMAKLMGYLYYQRYLKETGDVLKGKKLLSEKGCLKCHSVRGRGGKSARRLDYPSDYISPLFMAEALWNHGPEMEKRMNESNLEWPIFEGDEIVDLTNYLRIVRKRSPKEDLYLEPGNPSSGKSLFQSKGCVQCHAVAGTGGDIGPDFTRLSLDKSVTKIAGLLWNHGAEMMASMQNEGIEWPRFQGGEMGDIISYLYSIGFKGQNGEAVHGQRLFQDRGCSRCHLQQGTEEAPGPNLALLMSLSSPIQMAQVMWNHAPDMETKMQSLDLPWPEFSERQMADLFAFLSQPSGVTEKH